jgi:cysteine synthase B
LKERNPAVQMWAVEPPSGETVDGLRNLDDGFVPPVFTDNGGPELLDEPVMVALVADGGWKYLSTGVWTDDLDDVVERANRLIYF